MEQQILDALVQGPVRGQDALFQASQIPDRADFDALLASLLADGKVELRGGVYRLPLSQPSAAHDPIAIKAMVGGIASAVVCLTAAAGFGLGYVQSGAVNVVLAFLAFAAGFAALGFFRGPALLLSIERRMQRAAQKRSPWAARIGAVLGLAVLALVFRDSLLWALGSRFTAPPQEVTVKAPQRPVFAGVPAKARTLRAEPYTVCAVAVLEGGLEVVGVNWGRKVYLTLPTQVQYQVSVDGGKLRALAFVDTTRAKLEYGGSLGGYVLLPLPWVGRTTAGAQAHAWDQVTPTAEHFGTCWLRLLDEVPEDKRDLKWASLRKEKEAEWAETVEFVRNEFRRIHGFYPTFSGDYQETVVASREGKPTQEVGDTVRP